MALDLVKTKMSRALVRAVRTRTARARAPVPFVSFTFDDVHASAATTGAAILDRHAARGTFYVAGSLLGTVEPERTAASAEQCVSLHARGHELACHTYTHVQVAAQSRAELASDLRRNQAVFNGLGVEANRMNFAYPFNEATLATKRQLERRFVTCRGGVPGLNAGVIDAGFLRAVELHDDGIDAARAAAWIDLAKQRSAWLIFFTHGVQEEPQPWRCTPALLERTVAAARAAGCEIGTVAAAVERLGLA